MEVVFIFLHALVGASASPAIKLQPPLRMLVLVYDSILYIVLGYKLTHE